MNTAAKLIEGRTFALLSLPSKAKKLLILEEGGGGGMGTWVQLEFPDA